VASRKIESTIEALREYKPVLTRPDEFEEFWSKQKELIHNSTIRCDMMRRNYPVNEVEVYDLVLHSFDETPIKGVLVKPASEREVPLIHVFHGYTGDSTLVMNYLKWALLGIAVVSFDVRGQGTTPDYARYLNGTRTPGWMVQGILDKENYYYINVYRDIIAQLKWAKDSLPFQTAKVGALGSSQGGGLALVAAGLEPQIEFIVADWPFITHFEKVLDEATAGPYLEIVQYFKNIDPQYTTYNQAMETLSYMDALHFCPEISAPVLMGIGLLDNVAPASAAFAAFNHLGSKEKQLEIYPLYVHEPNPFHEEKRIEFIYKHTRR
jgi:cephalosporin-C deacetylase